MKYSIVLFFLSIAVGGFAQTTTITNNGRNYYVNRTIGGNSTTEYSAGPNYILLHQAYNGTILDDHHVMGTLTGVRGSTTTWNRKWTVQVNTASAYDANRGSILTYNEEEDVALVTLTYGGVKYLAAQIGNGPSISEFSFTGYAYNESLTLVTDDVVSNVQEFIDLDPLSLQGDLYVGNNIGIGTITPQARLHVLSDSAVSSNAGSNTQPFTGNMIIQAGNSGSRSSTMGVALEFAIPADNDGTNPWGQARIITVAGNQNNTDATGKMILGTRRFFNKLGTGTQWNYGDDIVIDGSGNVGIGTTDPKGHKLAVAGDIIATEVNVKLQSDWPDYVFDSAYNLPSLTQVAQYIQQNNHLPNVLSAKEVEQKGGVALGNNQAVLLRKIEELTLYVIDQDKKATTQQQQLTEQSQLIANQSKLLQAQQVLLLQLQKELTDLHTSNTGTSTDHSTK